MLNQPKINLFIKSLFKGLFIVALIFLGTRAALFNLDAAKTDNTFSFLSQNNRGFAGLLIQASQEKLQTSPQEAILLLQKAIQKDPVDSRSYLLMALAYEKLGDMPRAKTLMRIANQLSPRKPLNQIEIGQFWFRQNDIDEALMHWTIALEMKYELREKGFKDLMLFMERPIYFEAMRRLISKHNPLWWDQFFNQAAFSFKHLDHLKALYETRLSSGVHMSNLEHSAIFERLMRDRQWSAAYFLWINHLPQSQLKFLGNIFDGGFNLSPSNEGFGWRINTDPAYRFYFNKESNKGSSQILTILFTGSKPKEITLMRQILLLEPGTFHLKGEVSSEQLKAGEGLMWRLSCYNGLHIATTSLFQGSMAWGNFSQDFTVPSHNDCRVQTLSLMISADINQPFTYEGVLKLKQLAILRSKTALN